MTNITTSRIACTFFDADGARRDIDAQPYLEVLVVDGQIYSAETHRVVDGKLVGEYGRAPSPMTADADGLWVDAITAGGMMPYAGEVARLGLAD